MYVCFTNKNILTQKFLEHSFIHFRKTLGAPLGRDEVIDYCKFDLKIPKSKQKQIKKNFPTAKPEKL